jgi:hypothetical protein
MPTFDELDRLSTQELRSRAFRVARHRLDLGFFWRLLEYTPVAEAIGGHTEHAQADVLSLSATVEDAIDSGEGEVEDALRPVYIEYLQKHDTGEA